MWKRFLIGGVLVVALSFAATLTVALNTATSIAEKVFRNTIVVPTGLVTPVYSGGPQTFLVLGSDRRAKAKSAYDRSNPPHSDTILLVRLDPEQGQTSVLSIPRDLMVNISGPHGQYYPSEKINAAYTIGSKLGGSKGGMVLAAETIEHEVFPGLKLNGIIDVNFAGFIKVVDTLGCAYVNVDHRYYNQNVGSAETDFTSINLQPGYQKLCYENALAYVRYRHTDSDFVRVARQQAALARPPELATDRVGGVDLLVAEDFPGLRPDVDEQVAGNREHRRLPVAGVEAHEQQRVAVRRVLAVERVAGVRAAVGAEHQEGLRPAVVFGRDQAFRRLDVAQRREHLGGQVGQPVERHRGGRRAGQGGDQQSGQQKPLPHAPPEPRRAIVRHRLFARRGCNLRPDAGSGRASQVRVAGRSASAAVTAGTLGSCSVRATASCWGCCPRPCS